MPRASFALASLALHGAALAFAWHAPHASGPPSALHDEARALELEPLLLAGSTVAPAPETAGHAKAPAPIGLSTPAPTPATRADAPSPSPASHAHLPAPRAANGAHARAIAPAGPEASLASASAAGAGASLFGTLPLRAFLLALSADPRALADAAPHYALRYAADDAAAAQVLVVPADAAGQRLARALAALLDQARAAGAPTLEGRLAVTLEAGLEHEGAFTITCNEGHRSGSVQFAHGLRVRVEEPR